MSRISFGMLEAGYIPGDLGAFKKEGGKIRLYGESPSQPTQMTQTSLTYGEELQPFATEMMRRTGALASQDYVPYEYNRIAEFDPMQLQAQQAAANMRVSPYVGQSAGILSGVVNRAGQIGQYDPTRFMEERVRTGQFNQPGAAASYMSPYMQNVVDIGKREAARQDAIAGGQRAAQAVGAGAFGGSRQAIMEAEANRNLMQQMGDIQAKGSQAAYEQAAQQFQQDQARMLQAAMANQAKNLEAQQLSEQSRQFGADIGLRGLQQQLMAAQQFNQLAGTQFGQARDIIGMQATAGSERQARAQRKLTQDYEDFLAQKRFPYEQAQFASSMLRGMPMSSTQTIYQAPPSAASQAVGYAGGAYGLSRLASMANGGLAGLAINNLARG
jgi:hypothetical protein